MKALRRLPLNGLCNLRDLGGWPTAAGKMTRFGVFYRSEAPVSLSTRELALLHRAGIGLALDLRSEREIREAPNALANASGFSCRTISLYNPALASPPRQADGNPIVWSQMHRFVLDHAHSWLCEVFTALAEAKTGVLFHCATGKDRTGIIAALLLRLCGVSAEDAAADYSLSQLYLRACYDRYASQHGGVRPAYAETPAENMLELLDGLCHDYGSEETFLLSCGIASTTLEAIRTKFLEAIE